MFDVIDMPNNWPVEVNFHEAKAFCKWKGKGFRVLSEAEHHAIRDYEVYLSVILYKSSSNLSHSDFKIKI